MTWYCRCGAVNLNDATVCTCGSLAVWEQPGAASPAKVDAPSRWVNKHSAPEAVAHTPVAVMPDDRDCCLCGMPSGNRPVCTPCAASRHA